MSFQRKAVVIQGNTGNPNSAARGAPQAVVRGPPQAVPRGPAPIRGPAPVRGPPGSAGSQPEVPSSPPGFTPSQTPTGSRAQSAKILQHKAVIPSLQTSHPTVSTGCEPFDKLLGHGGLPLGSTLLIEESGSTDYAGVLLHTFAALGVCQMRVNAPTLVFVIGGAKGWEQELPAIYRSSKDSSSDKIRKENEKLSVANLARGAPSSDRGMKIAWRYSRETEDTTEEAISSATKPYYTATFDHTARMSPRASSSEMTTIHGTKDLPAILRELEAAVKSFKTKGGVVRVVIPSFLHPSHYVMDASHPQKAIPFVHGLQRLCREYPHTLVVVMSLGLELFPRDSPVVRWIEVLFDGVVHLDPFSDEVARNVNDSRDEDRLTHGLVHVYKLPVTSERGMMHEARGEQAFRVSRKQFHIFEWGIPVDEAESEEPTKDSLEY